MADAAPAPAEVGIVVYPGVQLAAVHGLTDVFAIAGSVGGGDDGARSIRVTHWRAGPDTGGVSLAYDTGAGRPARPRVIVVPLTLVDLPAPEVVCGIAAWLKARHAAGAAIASVCSGVFLLAEAGLLSGRSASTHWSCADALAARFPDIRVERERGMIDYGDVITAGGFMAWVDLALALVDRLLGPSVAFETARFLTVDPRHDGRGYLNGFTPHLAHGDAAVLRAQHWLHGRDARDASLAAMAERAGLEKRTLLRRFSRATGLTPAEYARQMRIARARELLEYSQRPAKEIAWMVGYRDLAAFARAFRRVAGMSPGDYRRRAAEGRMSSGVSADAGSGRLGAFQVG